MSRVLHQSFAVSFDYPVVFTRHAFDPSNRALVDVLGRRGEPRVHRCLVFIDDAVTRAHPTLQDDIARYAEAHAESMVLAAPPVPVQGGEWIKNSRKPIAAMVRTLVARRLDRQSFVLAIGGGAVLDAVGFAAALVHRGVRLVRFPTTVLAQNDAGVGVKNAINMDGVKNLIGTFAPPFAVINDSAFLETLPADAWTDGIAEAFKVALIKDAAFFEELCHLAPRLKARDLPSMERLVARCAELHLEHIRTSGDPFELGHARPLDFGHWSAHRLETMSGHSLHHGAAVAIGLALDARYAANQGWLEEKDFLRLARGLRDAGFALWHPLLAERDAEGRLEILRGLEDFQEHLGGELTVTMPRGIGRCFDVHEVRAEEVERAVEGLREAFGGVA